MDPQVVEASTGEQLLLDEAVETCPEPRQITILDDETGALVAGVRTRYAAVPSRVHDDLLSAEERVRSGLGQGSDELLTVASDLGGAVDATTDLVLLNLPKSLAALDEIAQAVARGAGPEVRLLGLGRVRHMSRGMNDVLARSFGSVRASRGRGKYRVLVAGDPHTDSTGRMGRAGGSGGSGGSGGFPQRARDADLDLTVCAHGAAFAGTKIDRGTRLLAGCRDSWPAAATIVDLGCGTGVLAALAARRQPTATVLALDESAAACASARATAEANGLDEQIQVRRADGLTGLADASVDLILCNPPFHVGTAKDSAPALAMFDDVARVLRPDGELWTVFNTHLPYRQALRSAVGPTGIFTQDPSYLVTRTRHR